MILLIVETPTVADSGLYRATDLGGHWCGLQWSSNFWVAQYSEDPSTPKIMVCGPTRRHNYSIWGLRPVYLGTWTLWGRVPKQKMGHRKETTLQTTQIHCIWVLWTLTLRLHLKYESLES